MNSSNPLGFESHHLMPFYLVFKEQLSKDGLSRLGGRFGQIIFLKTFFFLFLNFFGGFLREYLGRKTFDKFSGSTVLVHLSGGALECVSA